MTQITSFRKLLLTVHRDQRGTVSLETVLIVGAIALPLLIYVLKYGWPKVREFFFKGIQDLEGASNNVVQGG